MSEKNQLSIPTLEQIEKRLESIESSLGSMKKNHHSSNQVFEWLNTKQVAKALGISIRTLQTYRDQGTFPFSQFGREIRYRSEDIQSFLMQHYVEPRFWKGGQV